MSFNIERVICYPYSAFFLSPPQQQIYPYITNAHYALITKCCLDHW